MSTGFAGLGLRDSLLDTLEQAGYHTPTEIQKRVIPALLGGHAVAGVAETGSGKTLAYGLPILHLLKALEDAGMAVTAACQPRAVIITPTRELGEQVARELKLYTHDTRVRIRMLLGSTSMEVARRSISGTFEILVATPGRLVRFLDDRLLSLSAARYVVLDEADQLLDMGFQKEIRQIVHACSPARIPALFTATWPLSVEGLVTELFENPVVIRSQGSHRLVETLQTSNRSVDPRHRVQALLEVVNERPEASTLVFVNTREQCEELGARLREAGLEPALYHGELEKEERRENYKAFKEGRSKLLIATDLGSRGLHVEGLERVVNAYLPRNVELYLHRVGRTARAGESGEVVNFVTERDEVLLKKLASVKPSRSSDAKAPVLVGDRRLMEAARAAAEAARRAEAAQVEDDDGDAELEPRNVRADARPVGRAGHGGGRSGRSSERIGRPPGERSGAGGRAGAGGRSGSGTGESRSSRNDGPGGRGESRGGRSGGGFSGTGESRGGRSGGGFSGTGESRGGRSGGSRGGQGGSHGPARSGGGRGGPGRGGRGR